MEANDFGKIMSGLKDDAAAYEETADAAGFDLRLDFASMILREMKSRNKKQKEMADAIGMSAAQFNRIVNAETNLTFDSAGRVLHAFELRACFKVRSYPEEQPRLSHGDVRIDGSTYSGSQPLFRETAFTQDIGDTLVHEG